MKATNAKAIAYDAVHMDANEIHSRLPVVVTPNLESLPLVSPESLSPLPDVQPSDIALITHTSGSTSGMPKPIPQTHKWARALALSHPARLSGQFGHTQIRINHIGSFAHIGSIAGMPCCILHGDST